MPNMDPQKCPMPLQDPAARITNFDEVALGYTKEMAITEANRCLQCKNHPCVDGCPVGIDIPGFVGKVAEADFAGAFEVLTRMTNLPAVCGRVCPQESQCEKNCVRGIKDEPVGIGRLERFVADWNMAHGGHVTPPPPPNGHKVAVIGSGPVGLTVAGDLAKMGYAVTIYEALHKAGGVLVYGIPEFRLPKDIVQAEIDNLEKLGVSVQTNMVIGKVLTIDELFEEEGNEAIFVGSGAGLPNFLNIPGENYNGVFSANEFLTRVNLMQAWHPGSRTPVMKADKVAVIGGGNVAMDAARCARRLGASEVTIVYRRSMDELPARREEVEHAMEEGILFRDLTNPKEVLADDKGNVRAIRCRKCRLGEPDSSGRRRPVEIDGSDFELPVDGMVVAIGTSPNPLIHSTTPGLQSHNWGGLIVQDESGQTSREGVYAGGDIVTGSATVILAMGAGKLAAEAIDEYIKGKK